LNGTISSWYGSSDYGSEKSVSCSSSDAGEDSAKKFEQRLNQGSNKDSFLMSGLDYYQCECAKVASLWYNDIPDALTMTEENSSDSIAD
jgi:hypothetical protein